MASRVFRGIAILFLLYTGAEMTPPQYCNEVLSLPKTSEVLASSTAKTLPAIEGDSEKDLPSDRPSSEDEDCFCCCAHVLPGIAVALNAVPQTTSSVVDPQNRGLASPPLQSPYHPPKSS